jgi:hypothetical protein
MANINKLINVIMAILWRNQLAYQRRRGVKISAQLAQPAESGGWRLSLSAIMSMA